MTLGDGLFCSCLLICMTVIVCKFLDIWGVLCEKEQKKKYGCDKPRRKQ